ncbi:SDR family oxidoreductase [uncultured Mesotoga sp.]|uniref:SDR family oxidoreductase n=1 Tax=uncultured Mesotoga sp. TaxID=1184400 RepID=UPI0025947BC2|nr:SDR family oxidoreductase [uncultured Mesotoga sp.]
MKFLVLGAAGMAGHTISTYLSEKGHDVIGFDRVKGQHSKFVVGDARNVEFIRGIITQGRFDSVINCIGILNQFAEENRELAVFLNSYLPHFLAEITKDMETQIIHMSTDCVFSGKRGGYTESDLRDGETFYDRTKALGELEDEKNITLRNSIVGPDMNENGIGLFNWFMKQNRTIKGYTRAMWTGLTTLELAKTMEQAAKKRASGLYNMVYSEPISKYDLLKLFNKYMRNDELNIEPFDGFVADKSLKRTRFEFGYVVPDYETMVSEMAEWIMDHKYYYPHYNL